MKYVTKSNKEKKFNLVKKVRLLCAIMILMMLFKIVIRFGTLIRRSESRAQNLKKCLPKRSQRQLVVIGKSNET